MEQRSDDNFGVDFLLPPLPRFQGMKYGQQVCIASAFTGWQLGYLISLHINLNRSLPQSYENENTLASQDPVNFGMPTMSFTSDICLKAQCWCIITVEAQSFIFSLCQNLWAGRMAQEIKVLATWQEKTSSYRLTSILVPCHLYTHPYTHRHILYCNFKILFVCLVFVCFFV